MNLRKKDETNSVITLEWDQIVNAEGFMGLLDGSETLVDGKRHFSLKGDLTTMKLGKPQDGKPHAYGVRVLGKIDEASITSPTPTPPPPPVINLGSALPKRMPESSGTGGTFYVDPANGNDGNNGSASSPWKTINKAISTVPLSGSIIIVKPGTIYSAGLGSGIPINWSRPGNVNDPVTIQAEKPGTVVILTPMGVGQAWGGWLRGSGLRIRGLVFRSAINNSSQIHTSAFLIEAAQRIEIDNCEINEFGSVSTSVRGVGSSGTSDDIWFHACKFKPSGSDPFAQVTGCNFPKGTYFGSRGSHFLYAGQWGANPSSWDGVNGCRRMVVVNCIFIGSTYGRDIELGPECRDSFVVNCSFYGNHAIQLYGNGDPSYALNGYAAHDGGGVALQFFANTSTQQYASGNNVIKNNICKDLDGHGAYGSGPTEGGNVVDYNLCYGLRNGYGYQGRSNMDFEPLYGSAVLFALGSHNRNADPLFNNPNAYDLSLKSNSPAKDGGDAAYCYPTDIDGNLRQAASLGAYA